LDQIIIKHKKAWNKPSLLTVYTKELINHIKVSARSGGTCEQGYMR